MNQDSRSRASTGGAGTIPGTARPGLTVRDYPSGTTRPGLHTRGCAPCNIPVTVTFGILMHLLQNIPENVLPMSPVNIPRTPLLTGIDVEEKRAAVLEYFDSTWERYESLFKTLRDDRAYYEKPIPLRHPLIFYFGHTATFFVNKLILAGMLEHRINPAFESMFAVGVDEMSWDDLDETHYDWPSVEEVRAYRKTVRELLHEMIRKAPLTLPIDWNNPWWMILMGIEHEQIHLETSSVLIRQQSLDLVQTHPDWRPCRESGPAPENELVPVPAGTTMTGKTPDDPFYGWDNEYGQHETRVSGFLASRYLVSNEEFLPFVQDNGYETNRYWTEEGRQWRDFSRASRPTFWVPGDHGWKLRLMTEVIAMPWNWPVEVNCHEARAFCAWKSEQTGEKIRLPTEHEWYRLYDESGVSPPETDARSNANWHLDHFASSMPVDRFAHGDFYDVVGNVWQWTETAIYPFPGFRVHPCYDDFTMPTFDGKHNLIKGGSWISSGNECLRSSRYAFRRHFFQHAGFRYVRGDDLEEQPVSNYENDKMLSEYAEFHFGDTYFDVPNFPKALVEIAMTTMDGKPARRALDIGCAAGRSTFELAKYFEHVTGMDFSARLIGLGVQLAEQGFARYSIVDEGELMIYHERRLEDLGLSDTRHRVEFLQGDACNLKPVHTGYDLVLAANLIDRLYDPALFLQDIQGRINDGGILLIASPYTWLAEHTKREDWLGGYKKDGENYTTLDGLKDALAPSFRLLKGPIQVPFVIRETSRKFQHTLSDVTVWEKQS